MPLGLRSDITSVMTTGPAEHEVDVPASGAGVPARAVQLRTDLARLEWLVHQMRLHELPMPWGIFPTPAGAELVLPDADSADVVTDALRDYLWWVDFLGPQAVMHAAVVDLAAAVGTRRRLVVRTVGAPTPQWRIVVEASFVVDPSVQLPVWTPTSIDEVRALVTFVAVPAPQPPD